MECAYDEDVLTLEARDILVGSLDALGDLALVLVAAGVNLCDQFEVSVGTYIVARS